MIDVVLLTLVIISVMREREELVMSLQAERVSDT